MIAVVQIVCNLEIQHPVAELAEQMARSRSEMSSWVHGSPFSRRCSADRESDQKSTVRSVARENLGLLSLVNTGFTNPGNPSEPSLFSALFLAIQISLSFFSTSGAHFRVSTGGHVPEVPE
ncbi:hypothetical protein TNCV_1696431 [Trichonephila clavipes]|nr:hypothetical protein TNCV_1696431 [Trichonephila clavipes]